MNIYAFLSLVSFLLFFQAFIHSFFFLIPRKNKLAFMLFSLSFSIFALFFFFINISITIEQVYFFDRFAAIGWTTFPVWIAWLLSLLSNNESKTIRRLIWFLLLPAAMVALIRYNFEPETIKFFYFREGVVLFTVNRMTPWFYIFVVYLFFSAALSIKIWLDWKKKLNTNREREQVKAILIGMLIFVFFSIITNLLLPFVRNSILSPLAHINALPLGAGLYISVMGIRKKTFISDIVSRLITNHIREFVFYFDHQGNLFAFNHYCLENLKFNSYELIRTAPGKIFDDFQQILVSIPQLNFNRVVSGIPSKLFSRSGAVISVNLSMVRINDYLGNYQGFALLGQDMRQKEELEKEVAERTRNEKELTEIRQDLEILVEKRTQELAEANERLKKEILERKRAEQRISADLEEKAQLVKEIHHRVKNNIQIIISLTNMTGTHKVMDSLANEKLRQIAERIRNISAVHEKFYSSPNLSRISFSEFIKKATGEIYAHHGYGQNIIFRLNVGNEYLEIDQAIPCGIIYVELLTNALKHAFPNAEDGEGRPTRVGTINVEFYKRLNEYTLQVSDNGIGLDGRGKQRQDGITGLGLVNILVNEHLKGVLTTKLYFGTSYVLKFNT